MSVEPLGPVEALSDTHEVDQFDCGVAELDQWLRRSARVAAAAGTAATYIVCRGRRVIGCHALAMNSIGHEPAPSRLRRGMPDPVPVVLLARLAIDLTERGRRLGGHLLVDALRRCLRGGREFGARAVVVDAINEQAAEFYRHFATTSTNGVSGGAQATSNTPSVRDNRTLLREPTAPSRTHVRHRNPQVACGGKPAPPLKRSASTG